MPNQEPLVVAVVRVHPWLDQEPVAGESVEMNMSGVVGNIPLEEGVRHNQNQAVGESKQYDIQKQILIHTLP
jgi:hypothetical protein